MSHPADHPSTPRSPAIALSVLLAWGALALWIVGFRRIPFPTHEPIFTGLALFSGFVCWIMLLWAFHHLAYQIVSLLHRPHDFPQSTHTPAVAILYTTRDDFSPNACRSCIDQNYPNFRVLVCDDSQTDHYRELVSEFCREYPSLCKHLRRQGHDGFKAGNLNHALDTEVDNDEWILLVDADQELPHSYLHTLVSFAPESDPQIGFIQGANITALDARSSELERAMAPGAASFCRRDLPPRNTFGFVPMLGHGTLITSDAWKAFDGFPHVVSEDFAFAMQAARLGLRGLYVPSVVSHEAYPHDFSAFVIRLKKYASGTAQLFRREIPEFLFLDHKAFLVERWDLLLMLGWYLLIPALLINGFVAAYVCHRFWMEEIPIVSPLIPYLFTWLILATYSVLRASCDHARDAWRFYFWSSGLFVSVLPLASWAFLKHLVFASPVFERTPKNGTPEPLRLWECRGTQLLGIVALILSAVWYSPYSFVLAGQGLGYLSFPLYAHLGANSKLGRLARLSTPLPGLLFLIAVGAIWYSNTS